MPVWLSIMVAQNNRCTVSLVKFLALKVILPMPVSLVRSLAFSSRRSRWRRALMRQKADAESLLADTAQAYDDTWSSGGGWHWVPKTSLLSNRTVILSLGAPQVQHEAHCRKCDARSSPCHLTWHSNSSTKCNFFGVHLWEMHVWRTWMIIFFSTHDEVLHNWLHLGPYVH